MSLLPVLILLLATALTGCGGGAEGDGAPEPPAPQEPVAWLQAHTALYLDEQDPTWRRARLEETLWRPELRYSKKILDHYALAQGGWDALPDIDFEVQPLRADATLPLSQQTFVGERLLGDADWSEATSQERWLELGERVFWLMPMRRDAYVEWLAGEPQLWDQVGLEVNAETQQVRGLVRYRDARGDVRVGMTCGLCHGARGTPGLAARTLDLGRARAAFDAQRGQTRQVPDWGPGRVDVTDDGIEDSVAIPNLYGLAQQRYFNVSGVVRISSPASAAIRYETQYMLNHGYEARPRRELTWALTMYTMSLEPPPPPQPASPDMEALQQVGAAHFEASCAGCHLPSRGFSGELVLAAQLGSDQLASRSPDRGTGFYRVPSLRGIGEGPYLHDLSAPTLEALLERGHPNAGARIEDEAARAALIAYLRTL